VPTIPQRELRNNVSDVLRRAEGGERFTITVNRRPVAELGPARSARFAPAQALAGILSDGPVDAGWAQELDRMRREDHAAASDPWTA
jgi:prevent-host-death family protein